MNDLPSPDHLPAVPAGPEDTRTTHSRIIAIVAASSGNLVEWFDFYVYSATSIYFAASFFPKGDTVSQQLSSAGVFAVACSSSVFVFSPSGSIRSHTSGIILPQKVAMALKSSW